MNYENLYEQSKWKKQHQTLLQQQKQQQIRLMSASKKINHNSNLILINKLYEQLTHFEDENIVNIETSIPVLHATKILQVIESIESAKERLERGEFENNRLKEEAKFVYCLWKMIDEEEIETRQLKEIIYMLHDKNMGDLKRCLGEIYADQESVLDFVESWKVLQQDNQYYKSIERLQKKQQAKNEHQKEIEKIIGFESGLKDLSYKNESKQIRDLFLNSHESHHLKGKLPPEYELFTMESMNYSSKNKENTYLDRSKEQALINRLYQVDKYKAREAQKKIDDQVRAKKELDKCTFKPQLVSDRLRSASRNKRSSSINGYQKTVHRMKVGNEKTRIEKERREHKPIGQNYEKIREKKINPPKFLERKKEQEIVLFVIQFDLGRHKVKVKIHETDSEESIARNLCKIYCLKQDYYDQICMIVRKERQIYEAEKAQ